MSRILPNISCTLMLAVPAGIVGGELKAYSRSHRARPTTV
jgi:hypothetical protein